MDQKLAIETLRAALAAIWTELEKEEPEEYRCQEIADEALMITLCFAKPGKDLTNDTVGWESWVRYRQDKKV